jgi:hypothetical protein
MSDHEPAYTRFVQELAHYPDMIDRLLAWHPARGVCHACRLPSALVSVPAPCSIRVLAEHAAAMDTGAHVSRRKITKAGVL